MSDHATSELRIKNMVCPRCIMVVRETLEKLEYEVHEVELGLVVVEENPKIKKEEVREKLKEVGFDLLEGRDQQQTEQIKAALIDYVKKLEEWEETPKISDYLSDRLNKNYSSLSATFSETEDVTIEKYLIHLKIERVKELLSYAELTLSEIAWKLNYSSVAHLSNQFKQVTGMSVTDYKKARESFRKPLDGIEE